jgi:hypothetical protein
MSGGKSRSNGFALVFKCDALPQPWLPVLNQESCAFLTLVLYSTFSGRSSGTTGTPVFHSRKVQGLAPWHLPILILVCSRFRSHLLLPPGTHASGFQSSPGCFPPNSLSPPFSSLLLSPPPPSSPPSFSVFGFSMYLAFCSHLSSASLALYLNCCILNTSCVCSSILGGSARVYFSH